MRENDYTGSPIDEDDDSGFLAADVDLYEFDPDDEVLADEFAALDENEQDIHITSAADGAKTLRETAEKLYDFADELIALVEEGWEIVDDIANGHGVAVRFDFDPEDEL